MGPALPGMSAPSAPRIYDELNRVIAALHRVDFAQWAWRTTASPATTSSARSRAGRKQYRASETEQIEAMER